jgi:cytochrome c
MRNAFLAACLAPLIGYSAAAAESPNLGKAASPEEIASWDVSIGPDGAGLPPGSGTPRQGEQVYLAKCLAWQGSLEPGHAPAKTIGSFWPYATTVFDYVRRAMPLNDPKSLRDDEVYAVVAYILQLNGVIGENDTMDAQTLPAVRMPNRDGFIRFSRGR